MRRRADNGALGALSNILNWHGYSPEAGGLRGRTVERPAAPTCGHIRNFSLHMGERGRSTQEEPPICRYKSCVGHQPGVKRCGVPS